MIYVESKKKAEKTLLKKYPNAEIIDITSQGEKPWVKISPFYPHGGIPVPYSPNCYAMSVEGIWQGLKVFEDEGIDTSKFEITNMKGLKRTVRKFGKPLGHQKGVDGTELLDYLTARREIYLRIYGWVLDNKVNDIIIELKAKAEKKDIVLLDYNTNNEIYNPKQPLSHAVLVKKYLEKKYPELATLKFEQLEQLEQPEQPEQLKPSKKKKATTTNASTPKKQKKRATTTNASTPKKQKKKATTTNASTPKKQNDKNQLSIFESPPKTPS